VATVPFQGGYAAPISNPFQTREMRYGSGGVRKQRAKWIGFWRERGKQVSRVLGFATDMTKGDAREAVAEIVKGVKKETNPKLFGPFVEGPYFDFYTGKWKANTAENNKQRIRTHLGEVFEEKRLGVAPAR
jgi:hypothetical protein